MLTEIVGSGYPPITLALLARVRHMAASISLFLSMGGVTVCDVAICVIEVVQGFQGQGPVEVRRPADEGSDCGQGPQQGSAGPRVADDDGETLPRRRHGT